MTWKFSNKDALVHTYLKYKGTYNWKEILRFMRKWVEKNGYSFFDKKYKEKPGQYGMDIEWKGECEKKVDGYFKYYLKWEFRSWDQVPIEVIKDGRKVMMDEGRIRIVFDAQFTFDYEGQFTDTTVLHKLQDFLLFRVYGEEVWAIHWDGLYYEMNRFKNEVEAKLKMETATEGSPYHG